MIALVFLPLTFSYASIHVNEAIGYAPFAVGLGFLPARFSSKVIPLRALAPASTDGFRNSPERFLRAAALTFPSICLNLDLSILITLLIRQDYLIIRSKYLVVLYYQRQLIPDLAEV